MLFGLCNAAQQTLVDKLFGPRSEPNIFSYLDDIIIVSASFGEHVKLLGEVFQILNEVNLTINLKKSEFFKKSFYNFLVIL